MSHLLVIGAGGHGMVVAEAAEQMNHWQTIALLDDRYPKMDHLDTWSVLGKVTSAADFLDRGRDYIVAIGDNTHRLTIMAQLDALGYTPVDVVHPRSVISPRVHSRGGSVFLAGSVINARCVIGHGCIVNSAATIDHDCDIGDGVHIAPGAHLAANVKIGNTTWVGIGAAVREQISIGENSMVGAGAVVVADVPDNCTTVGVPAKVVKE